MRRFLLYFFNTIIILTFLIIMARVSYALNVYTSKTFNTFPLYIYKAVYPVIIGFIFAIPQLVCNLRKPGKISYDWVRALAIGFPTLLIGFGLILFLLSPWIQQFPNLLTITSPEVRLFGSMLFGYVIVTSIKKKPLDSEKISTFNQDMGR